MQWFGLLIGLSTFIIIGVFHPVVIKAEYYLGKRCWPVFLAGGLLCVIGALLIPLFWASALVSVLGFTLLWSIRELFEQEERVKKGWFPENPKRKSKNTDNKQ